jgi:hypothetical protein
MITEDNNRGTLGTREKGWNRNGTKMTADLTVVGKKGRVPFNFYKGKVALARFRGKVGEGVIDEMIVGRR